MATLAALTAELRILSNDTATAPYANIQMREKPEGLNDGSNTHFRLSHRNLITGSIYWSSASTYRSQTGVTIDDANAGLITISPAPAAGTQSAPFFIDYAYNWFQDSAYTEFLDDASRDLIGNGDPTTVIDALIAALLQYGLGYFWQRRATEYAHKYSSSGGQAGQSVDVVTKNFQNLAKMAFDRGKALRDDYYQRLGQRNAPASAIINYPIDPITPIR